MSGMAEKSEAFPSAHDVVFLPEPSGETAQNLESTQFGEKDGFLTPQYTPMESIVRARSQ